MERNKGLLTHVRSFQEEASIHRRANRKEMETMARTSAGQYTDEDICLHTSIYRVLFANEVAIQQIFELLDMVKRTPYCRHEVKRQCTKLRALAGTYRRQLDTAMTGTVDRDLTGLTGFANMNDYIDETLSSILEKTTYAVRLVLGQKGIKEGKLMAKAAMTLKVARIAEAIYHSEVRKAIRLDGGAIRNIWWISLEQIAQETHRLAVLLMYESHSEGPGGFDLEDNQAVLTGLKAFCDKLCSIYTIAKAIHRGNSHADSEAVKADNAAFDAALQSAFGMSVDEVSEQPHVPN
jgi:hypothetical protein